VRVLLTGATGLIGRAVLAQLVAEGHVVVAAVRSSGADRFLPQAARCISLDIAKATEPEDWLAHLAGIDAVVNCAGVLQDSPRDSTAGVHTLGPAALFAACEQAGVRRLVQISAVGVDRDDAVTAFARSKREGDATLMARPLDWVVLRPSVVVGRQAYGGSALFRGLAALPVLPRIAGTGKLQIVQLDDLVRTVLFFLGPSAPTRIALDVVGPKALSLEEVLTAYRRWLGLGEPLFLTVPRWAERVAFGIGDLLALLGWRPPLRSTTRAEIARGATGDAGRWQSLTGIAPRTLDAALAAEPASVQERWFARLYFFKPAMLATLAMFWIVSGLVALGPGWEEGIDLIERARFTAPAALAAAGAIADLLIGAGIAVRRTARAALLAGVVLSGSYLALATALLPGLWGDPLGSLVKVLPIVMLHLVTLAILDDR
jgi:uncharacterized protein YbjT (DUF2867 family)